MRLIVLVPFLALLSQCISSCGDSSDVQLKRRYDDGSWHPTKYDRPGRLRGYAINKLPLTGHHHHHHHRHHHHRHHHRPKIIRPGYSPPYRPVYRYRPSYSYDYGGNRAFCTKHELAAAVRACGHNTHITDRIYNSFLKSIVHAGITSKIELAMFLTQVIWESGGLKHKAELRCMETNCPHEYRKPGDPPGKFYYGRGYLQLSWSYNYRKASREIFGDDFLFHHPHWVEKSEHLAWATAAWFWKHNIHEKIKHHRFGYTTQYINGDLECKRWRMKDGRVKAGRFARKADKRFHHYRKVYRALNLPGEPKAGGCLSHIPPEFAGP